jgi:hypothetical protein
LHVRRRLRLPGHVGLRLLTAVVERLLELMHEVEVDTVTRYWTGKPEGKLPAVA